MTTMVSAEQRLRWKRLVLRHPSKELSAAHKTILLALETFADYTDGANAHPGEQQLADMCALGVQAARRALKCGRDLGYIQRVRLANRRRGLSDVYALTFPAVDQADLTGTVGPVDTAITGPTGPVDNPVYRSGETALPVSADSFTGPVRPPTFPLPSLHQGGVRNSGTSPEPPLDLTHPPSRYCDQHPHGYPDKCNDCRKAWIHFKAWQAAAAERDVALATADDFARRRQRQLIATCPVCDDNGLRDLAPPGSTESHLVRCQHGIAGQEASHG